MAIRSPTCLWDYGPCCSSAGTVFTQQPWAAATDTRVTPVAQRLCLIFQRDRVHRDFTSSHVDPKPCLFDLFGSQLQHENLLLDDDVATCITPFFTFLFFSKRPFKLRLFTTSVYTQLSSQQRFRVYVYRIYILWVHVIIKTFWK